MEFLKTNSHAKNNIKNIHRSVAIKKNQKQIHPKYYTNQKFVNTKLYLRRQYLINVMMRIYLEL